MGETEQKAYGVSIDIEYILFAILILFIVVILAFLSGIFGFGPSGEKVESQAYWQTADIAIIAAQLNETAGMLFVKNNMDTKIRIHEVGVGTETRIVKRADPPVLEKKGMGRIILEPNVHYIPGPKGKTYRYTISIRYTKEGDPTKLYFFTGAVPYVGVYT